MIVEIEGDRTEALLFGRACSIEEMRKRVKEVLSLPSADNETFISIFCRRYGFERVLYDEWVRPDFVIDLDTWLVRKGSGG